MSRHRPDPCERGSVNRLLKNPVFQFFSDLRLAAVATWDPEEVEARAGADAAFRAIPHRRTDRGPYDVGRRVPEGLLEEWVEEEPLNDATRERLFDLYMSKGEFRMAHHMALELVEED